MTFRRVDILGGGDKRVLQPRDAAEHRIDPMYLGALMQRPAVAGWNRAR